MADDDYSLVRRAQAGEQRAFAELVERYQRKAYGVALGLLKCPRKVRFDSCP